jgi:hypothetical protein
MNQLQRHAEIRHTLIDALRTGGVHVDTREILIVQPGPDLVEVTVGVGAEDHEHAKAICQELLGGVRRAGENLHVRVRTREE